MLDLYDYGFRCFFQYFISSNTMMVIETTGACGNLIVYPKKMESSYNSQVIMCFVRIA